MRSRKSVVQEVWSGLLVTVVVVIYFSAVVLLVAGCAGGFSPRSPKPPRGKYTLSQAQRWVEHMNSPEMRNRGYRQVKTK